MGDWPEVAWLHVSAASTCWTDEEKDVPGFICLGLYARVEEVPVPKVVKNHRRVTESQPRMSGDDVPCEKWARLDKELS